MAANGKAGNWLRTSKPICTCMPALHLAMVKPSRITQHLDAVPKTSGMADLTNVCVHLQQAALHICRMCFQHLDLHLHVNVVYSKQQAQNSQAGLSKLPKHTWKVCSSFARACCRSCTRWST